MNKRKYKKKCKALLKKAKQLGLELVFQPEYFNCKRLNCLWYGGELATIKLSDTFEIELNIYGDGRACLTDKRGDVIASVKDKNNMGVFGDEMRPHLKTDRHLLKAIHSGRLELGYNNWIEYDGCIKVNASETRWTFIDLGIICDNILDNDILRAINEVLDSVKDIKAEIIEIALSHYGIKVGDV